MILQLPSELLIAPYYSTGAQGLPGPPGPPVPYVTDNIIPTEAESSGENNF